MVNTNNCCTNLDFLLHQLFQNKIGLRVLAKNVSFKSNPKILLFLVTSFKLTTFIMVSLPVEKSPYLPCFIFLFIQKYT